MKNLLLLTLFICTFFKLSAQEKDVRCMVKIPEYHSKKTYLSTDGMFGSVSIPGYGKVTITNLTDIKKSFDLRDNSKKDWKSYSLSSNATEMYDVGDGEEIKIKVYTPEKGWLKYDLEGGKRYSLEWNDEENQLEIKVR